MKENQVMKVENNYHDLISIILPTYNRGYILENAIVSVINQTYENWELIIIDDASIDNTKSLIEKYTDNRIKYIHIDKNRGSNYCRNLGVRNSKGNYIAFLDSDNYWKSNKLEIQIKEFVKMDEDIAFVFCASMISNGNKKYIFPEDKVLETDMGKELCHRNFVDTNTILIKRKYFEEVGGFDEQIPRLQDWELSFRIINVYGYKAIYIPICLNYGAVQNDSIGRNNKKYADAMLYFIHKYPRFFNNDELIEGRIQGVFLEAEGEEYQYICNKIFEDYPCYRDVLYRIMTKPLIQFHRKERFYTLLYEWKLKSSRMSGEKLFPQLFVKKDMVIAIYGLGKWGELFYQEISKLPVKILYGIDKNVEEFHSLQIRKPTEELEQVDLLVVTIFQEFDAIKAELQKRYFGEIISIETLIKYDL